MSLSNLTTSGWVLFAWWLIACLEFVAACATRNGRRAIGGAFGVGVLTAWLLYLVTP